MIINTGCRTDIPGFYSEWLINRIKAGYVYVRNPYYKEQVIKYSLEPSVVDCLAFCSKNPNPMLKYLDFLDEYKYNQFWFVTITPYGKDIEPNVPEKEKVIEDFKILSKHVGINGVIWRYDPIFFGCGYNLQKHIEEFEKIAKSLKDYTSSCVISFLDLYEKVRKNAPDLKPPSKEEQIEIAKAFYKIGKENNMEIISCCEKDYLKDYGINIDGCMNQQIIEKAINKKIKVPQSKNKRENCNCILGSDIGAYNTCGHLCKYCYANVNANIVKDNMQKHIKTSPFLIGEEEKSDKIIIAKQKSFIEKNNNDDNIQLSLI